MGGFDVVVHVFIHDAAKKREKDERKIREVWESGSASWCWLDGADVERQLRIGVDGEGRDWEMIALVFAEDRVLIHHYMRARPWAYRMIEQARKGL